MSILNKMSAFMNNGNDEQNFDYGADYFSLLLYGDGFVSDTDCTVTLFLSSLLTFGLRAEL